LRGLRRRAGRFIGARNDAPTGVAEGPVADREMALLHGARFVPLWTKAREQLGYVPSIDPDEGWRRTIAWLAAAGYPVVRR